jgi:hypothetical protein
MVRQFLNYIWEKRGEKGTWTGERGKLRGDELDNRSIIGVHKSRCMREVENIASWKGIRSIRKIFI